MYKYNIDLPVLLIFFARPTTLAKVFERVKKARPSKLFLACDGPREGNKTLVDVIWRCPLTTCTSSSTLSSLQQITEDRSTTDAYFQPAVMSCLIRISSGSRWNTLYTVSLLDKSLRKGKQA